MTKPASQRTENTKGNEMITIDIRSEKDTATKFYLFLKDSGTLSMCGEDDDTSCADVCVIAHNFYPGSFQEWKSYIIEVANEKLGLLEH